MSMEIIHHHQWTPSKEQRYGSSEYHTRGNMLFAIGGAMYEARYRVANTCVCFDCSVLRDGWKYAISEVGFNIEENSRISKVQAEDLVRENLVSSLIAVGDWK